MSASGRPPASTTPSSGRVSPSTTRPRVVLPAPLAPTTATSWPGWRSRSTRSRARAGAARVADGDRADPDGHGRRVRGRRGSVPGRDTAGHRAGRWRVPLQGVEDPLGGGQPVGAGVVQAPDPADWGIQLRDQQQHRQGGSQLHRPPDQPDAQRHGHQRGRQGRGQVEHDAGQERQPQRGHGGPPVPVGDLADVGDLGGAPVEGPQGREPPHDIQEVRREPGQRLPVGPGPGAGRPADEGQEHRDDGQGDDHDHGRPQVDDGTPGQDGHRHRARQDDLGQVAGEVGLEAVDPLDGAGRELGAVGAPPAGHPVRGGARPARPAAPTSPWPPSAGHSARPHRPARTGR